MNTRKLVKSRKKCMSDNIAITFDKRATKKERAI